LRQSQKIVEQGVVQGGNPLLPPPPPQHLPSTRVPLLFVSERICTSKNPLAVVTCNIEEILLRTGDISSTAPESYRNMIT
jgi:hypothetical protein